MTDIPPDYQFVPADHLTGSSMLVKILAGAILSSLLGIAGYMVSWNSIDRAFRDITTYQLGKTEAMVQKNDERLRQLENIANVNINRINELERKLDRISKSSDK